MPQDDHTKAVEEVPAGGHEVIHGAGKDTVSLQYLSSSDSASVETIHR